MSVATPQINFYDTDWVNPKKYENNHLLRHNCLRIVHYIPGSSSYDHKIMFYSYCMTELPLTSYVEINDLIRNFTFLGLSRRNISSQQLYSWSAPIDLVERYQFYLNQLLTSNNFSLGMQVFYNCTMPRFGAICQYQFTRPHHSDESLYDIIVNFYGNDEYNPTTPTCYMHLSCNRGPYPSCLDWSEICDGKIDCLGNGIDEEHCWQLEINECKNDEYRCTNGQCIPRSFFNDHSAGFDCVDGSDELAEPGEELLFCNSIARRSVLCEDVICTHRPITSSCVREREYLLIQGIFSNIDSLVSADCRPAFKCLIKFSDADDLYSNADDLFCDRFCQGNTCAEILKNNCSDIVYFPSVPVLFGDIYFAYIKYSSEQLNSYPALVHSICYNNSDYDACFLNASKMPVNGMTCVHSERFLFQSDNVSFTAKLRYLFSVYRSYQALRKCHLHLNYTSIMCNRSTMYQCVNSSKCISIHRLIDDVYDCPHMDDEDRDRSVIIDQISQRKFQYFKCLSTDKYIHRALLGNLHCDCGLNENGLCDDEYSNAMHIQRNIVFQHICDRLIDLLPIPIGEVNETDETECEQWQCNNTYTHCNNVFNCPDGADETACLSYSTLNCSSKEHFCVSPYTNELACLSIEKANDGHVDCLGATDEPTRCNMDIHLGYIHLRHHFSCTNQSSPICIGPRELCNGEPICDHGDDEQFCTTNREYGRSQSVCVGIEKLGGSDVEKFLCNRTVSPRRWNIKRFRLNGMPDKNENLPTKKSIFSSPLISKTSNGDQRRCHHGLDLLVWSNRSTKPTTNTCLCPPSFYGSECQYQNERISLTIQFRALSDSWQTLFTIVISLVDDSDERTIHSYEQFSYFWLENCKVRFHIYLLYASQPKDSKKNYSIHIDMYEKVSLAHRGSLLFSIPFPFLPAHRLAYAVDIPRTDEITEGCSDNLCVHGKCIQYSNNPANRTFCLCKREWSGRSCTISHRCLCSSDSLCIGISTNNQSICVCPLNKFGPRCFLSDTICQSSSCEHDGQCIQNDPDTAIGQKFICHCRKGFSGDRCEIVDKKVILSFDKDLPISQSIFLHFIEIIMGDDPRRATTFRMIPLRKDSVTIYWTRPFHLLFIELEDKNYYLPVVEQFYNQSLATIETVKPSDRCSHIRELFNETFVQWPLIRRIKYYHVPCQKYGPDLSCFYDDVHFCLCYTFDDKRLANCFHFDHHMTFNCSGRSECEKDAQCFQDINDCPTRSICMCPPCSYGRRCQFSTNGFGLSLDAILGYHILPQISLADQPSIVIFSFTVTIIFLVAGLINGVSCVITFKNKTVREVGCGFYLFGSSITTLLIMMIFGLNFFILLLAQMSIISNRLFLQFQCHSLDFLLRVCLSLDQWLNACVALERAIMTIKGAGFVKKKSKQTAKFVIVILLLVILGTCIHDPIHRHLIDEESDDDDDDQKRLWCIVRYSPSLETYNYIVHAGHFFGPFLINFISAILLITTKARQQTNLHQQRSYKAHFKEQFQQHKHLLTAPVLLVILAVPRLLIAFLSKCMKSANDSWLFLLGYFISLLPPMLTFIIFILPSEFYKTELKKTLRRYRTYIQLHLNLHLTIKNENNKNKLAFPSSKTLKQTNMAAVDTSGNKLEHPCLFDSVSTLALRNIK